MFSCPHCGISIEVLKSQANCRIFRCGQYKSTGAPIPPHLSRILCEELVRQNKIYGCGRPFRLVGSTPEICDFI